MSLKDDVDAAKEGVRVGRGPSAVGFRRFLKLAGVDVAAAGSRGSTTASLGDIAPTPRRPLRLFARRGATCLSAIF